MLADPAMRVCKAYWTLIEEEGLSLRATYFINPEGIVKAFEFHDNSIHHLLHQKHQLGNQMIVLLNLDTSPS
jgi:alkyl hydroperoxide reductase subunit AhpC